jgi:hypothetical protein
LHAASGANGDIALLLMGEQALSERQLNWLLPDMAVWKQAWPTPQALGHMPALTWGTTVRS